jgi:hypothetical protein
VLTSIYVVMPVGRLSIRHALVGGVTATVLWEVTRHMLVWYFARLSQVSVMYGSLTTAIVVLLTMEVGATLLLFGAQVISEYERVLEGKQESPPKPMRTEAVPATPKPGEPGAGWTNPAARPLSLERLHPDVERLRKLRHGARQLAAGLGDQSHFGGLKAALPQRYRYEALHGQLG